MPSDSSRRAESMESGYGLDLELLASDEPPRPDSANGMNAQESGHAPALESSPAPISDESPDAPKPPREARPVHQEYGSGNWKYADGAGIRASRRMRLNRLRNMKKPSRVVAEIVVEASAPELKVRQASEPEAADDLAPENEEAVEALVSDDSSAEPEPSRPEQSQEDEVSSSIPVATDLPLRASG